MRLVYVARLLESIHLPTVQPLSLFPPNSLSCGPIPLVVPTHSSSLCFSLSFSLSAISSVISLREKTLSLFSHLYHNCNYSTVCLFPSDEFNEQPSHSEFTPLHSGLLLCTLFLSSISHPLHLQRCLHPEEHVTLTVTIGLSHIPCPSFHISFTHNNPYLLNLHTLQPLQSSTPLPTSATSSPSLGLLYLRSIIVF